MMPAKLSSKPLLASVQEKQRVLARRYHEEKLKAEAASHSKISFLAHLSHDIRTPLNHIIGFADLMRHETYGPLGDARYANYVDTIKGSGERLLAFFASILELAELESGEKAMRQDPFAGRRPASNCRAPLSHAGDAGGHRTHLRRSHAAQRCCGDRFCLERMLGNLDRERHPLHPAGRPGERRSLRRRQRRRPRNHRHRHRHVDRAARGGVAALRLRVRRRRADPEHGGAGLGISIARAIAELSGGRLAIDSRAGTGHDGRGIAAAAAGGSARHVPDRAARNR